MVGNPGLQSTRKNTSKGKKILPSGWITYHQAESPTIRLNHPPSGWITYHQAESPTTRLNHLPSGWITYHQAKSPTIRLNHLPLNIPELKRNPFPRSNLRELKPQKKHTRERWWDQKCWMSDPWTVNFNAETRQNPLISPEWHSKLELI